MNGKPRSRDFELQQLFDPSLKYKRYRWDAAFKTVHHCLITDHKIYDKLVKPNSATLRASFKNSKMIHRHELI